MERRIFHGTCTPEDLARNLTAHFSRGNYTVQRVGQGDKVSLQISTRSQPTSGGQTAVRVDLNSLEDGVTVQLGSQAILGVAASLGMTAISALRNPLNLLGRLDDLAQDIENLQLTDEIWKVIAETTQSMGASYELSQRLRRVACDYCDTANPVGEGNCIACGAPLGRLQPITCPKCGFVIVRLEKICPNCQATL